MSTVTIDKAAPTRKVKYGSMSRDRAWALKWSYFFLTIFATWAFRIGIEGSDIPLGASVSLFMVPILAIAAIFILRDVNKRGNEA